MAFGRCGRCQERLRVWALLRGDEGAGVQEDVWKMWISTLISHCVLPLLECVTMEHLAWPSSQSTLLITLHTIGTIHIGSMLNALSACVTVIGGCSGVKYREELYRSVLEVRNSRRNSCC
eukprot:22875-Chlamydomonas_euryale.AAC.1